MNDENSPQQIARCKRFYYAILHRALDDLNGLLCGVKVPDDAPNDTDEMGEDERQQLLADTLDWFLDEEPSQCSLDVVCDILDLNADIIRELVQQLARGHIPAKIRRRKSTAAQIAYIMDALERRSTPKQLAREMGLNNGSVRRIRIREWLRKHRIPARNFREARALRGERQQAFLVALMSDAANPLCARELASANRARNKSGRLGRVA